MERTRSSERALLDERARREVVRKARTLNWTWVVTLTFARPVRDQHAAQKMFREFTRMVARDVFGAHFRYLAVEGVQACDNYHFHVLIEAPPAALARDVHGANLRLAWHRTQGPTGRFDVLDYDPALKGVEYIVHQHDEWDFNVACTRTGACAHRTCALADDIWRTVE